MKIQSSNKQNFYITTLDECTCPDFVFRNKKELGLTCKHQRENIDQLKIEALKNEWIN